MQCGVVAGEVLDERFDLRPVRLGKSALAGRAEENPVSPLNRIGQRKPNHRPGRPAVAEAHQRREGLLQFHDACERELRPEGVAARRGQGGEVCPDFRDLGRQQGKVLADVSPQSLHLAGVRTQMGKGELLGLVLELQFGVGAGDRKA